MVKGKAQTRSGRTSVLADTLQTAVEFGLAKADGPEADPSASQPQFGAFPAANGSDAAFMPPPDDILDDDPSLNFAEPPDEVDTADRAAAETDSDAPSEESGEPAESALYAEPLLIAGMVARERPEVDGPLWRVAHEGQTRTESGPAEPEAREETTKGGADADGAAASVPSPMTNGGAPADAHSQDAAEEAARPRQVQERTEPVAAGKHMLPELQPGAPHHV